MQSFEEFFVSCPGEPTPIGVLISGTGSNLRALFTAITNNPEFGGRVVVVGSDRADAPGLDAAAEHGVATFAHELGAFETRDAWEQAMIAELKLHNPEVIVLAGFMRLVSGRFLANWPMRVVNTHPSLLPAFRGAHAIEDCLAYGAKITGCTVHFVDEELDHGPIIAQQAVVIRADDDVASLRTRIQASEHELLPHCVSLLCRGELTLDGRHVRTRKDNA